MAVVGDEYDQVSKAGGGHFFARHPVYGCHPVKQDLLWQGQISSDSMKSAQ